IVGDQTSATLPRNPRTRAWQSRNSAHTASIWWARAPHRSTPDWTGAASQLAFDLISEVGHSDRNHHPRLTMPLILKSFFGERLNFDQAFHSGVSTSTKHFSTPKSLSSSENLFSFLLSIPSLKA